MFRPHLKSLQLNSKTSKHTKSKSNYSELSSPNFKSFIRQITQEPNKNVFDDSIISSSTASSPSHYQNYSFRQNQYLLYQKSVLNNKLHQYKKSTLNLTMYEQQKLKYQELSLKLNRGIIHLSLVANGNLLTLHIMQVRNIEIKQNVNCSNILVKITIIPDEKPLECTTRIVPNLNNSSTFNEKFSFELTDDDLNKRVCLSVYESYENNRNTQLQGCLSFGIKNLLKKHKVCAWFYLLQDDVGIFRHRKVIEHVEKHVSSINRDVLKMEEHQITIPRGSENFGFKVVGQCPTFVGRVDSDSPAGLCGLRAGDYIVKINGKNVSRAQKDTVSHLIKNLRKSVTLDIHRPPSSSFPTNSNHDLLSLVSSTESSTCSKSSYPYSLSSHVNEQNRYQHQVHGEYSHKIKQPHQRSFVLLDQFDRYVEPKPSEKFSSQIIFETNDSSVMAQKDSPTVTLV